MSKQVKCFRIVWDNGSNASGEFPVDFKTLEEATDFGDEWVKEITEVEPIPEDEEGYTYEVIKCFTDGSHEYVDIVRESKSEIEETLFDV